MCVWNSMAGESTTYCCPRGPGTSLAFTCVKSECPAQARMGEAGISNDCCINNFVWRRGGHFNLVLLCWNFNIESSTPGATPWMINHLPPRNVSSFNPFQLGVHRTVTTPSRTFNTCSRLSVSGDDHKMGRVASEAWERKGEHALSFSLPDPAQGTLLVARPILLSSPLTQNLAGTG